MWNHQLKLDFSRVFSKKFLPFFAGFIVLLAIFILVLDFSFSIYSKYNLIKKSQHTSISPSAPHEPSTLLIRFREDYIPYSLEEEINKDKVGNILLNIQSSYIKIKTSMIGAKSASEKLLEINSSLNSIGVSRYEKLYAGNVGKFNDSYKLYLYENIEVEDVQNNLRNIHFIVHSEPNFIMELFSIPNDPSFGNLWGMRQINAPEAWDFTTGSTSITVAVIDSGVDLAHPDLSGNLTSGYNFYSNNSNSTDLNGHGTHVAGIIGAVGNNGIGVAGVNWNTKIMPLRVFSARGAVSSSTPIHRAILYAIDNGAKVINMSIGNPSGYANCAGTEYERLINEAVSRGVTVVVAAGNEGRDSVAVSPASCENAITTGATDSGDRRSIWPKGKSSNFGSLVDIAAPGTGILSTWIGGYRSSGGTSMASPHVAGAAALLLSINPSLSPQEVRDCLVNNGDPISTDKPIGNVRLNIASAIANCSDGSSIPTPTLISTPTPSTTPVRYFISGRVFKDSNGDGAYTPGEGEGIVGEEMELSGGFFTTTPTITDGFYIFDGLLPGDFNVTYKTSSQTSSHNGIILTQTQPFVENVDFIIPKDTVVPTPRITSPTPTSVLPTSVPTSGSISTPTPTPITIYTCEYDPDECIGDKKVISNCSLKCTQK